MHIYVKLPGVQSRLKMSKERILYIYGAAGYGKTTAVEHFFRRKKHRTILGREGVAAELPKLRDLADDVVVVDDLHRVTDDASREYIRELCIQGGRQIVLIGRGPLPGWLMPVDMKKSFLQCGEADLEFGEAEISPCFQKPVSR